MADAADLKSAGGNPVRVRVPPAALYLLVLHNGLTRQAATLENSNRMVVIGEECDIEQNELFCMARSANNEMHQEFGSSDSGK